MRIRKSSRKPILSLWDAFWAYLLTVCRPGTKTRNSRVKRVTRNSTRLDSNSV
jgi:hypothetical protein